MNILKKENWWIWLILAIFTGGSASLVLAALLGVYDKDAWYIRWTKKCSKKIIIAAVAALIILFIYSTISIITLDYKEELVPSEIPLSLSIVSLIYSAIGIIATIFTIQILAQTNAKLKTPGSEIYLSPYIWILCIIIPILGWIMLAVMLIYLSFWYIVMLYRGSGEKYIS